jgi:signal peptidase II
MSFSRKILILNFTSAVLFVFDRLTKWLILKTSYERSFLFSFLKIEFQKNAGFWGMEINKYFLLIVTFVILTIILFLLIKSYQKKNFFLILILTLILTGAFSNLADRLIYGGVIDFINLFSYSTFNLADCLIITGVGLWLIKELIYPNYLNYFKQKNRNNAR